MIPGPTPVDPPISVQIGVAKAAHKTADRFLGINLDSSRIKSLNYSDPMLLKLAARFAGSTFRVGGTQADLDFYTESGGTMPPWAPNHIVNRNSTHDIGLWDKVYNFAKDANLRLLFDVNALGSRLSDNTWDSTNAEQLLAHIKRQGYDKETVLQGFQFGNEPFLDGTSGTTPSVGGFQLAKDFHKFRDLITAQNLSLELAGPDEACVGSANDLKNMVSCYPDQVHFGEFVHGAASAASAFSFHFYRYTGSNGCVDLAPEDFIDAKKLGDYHGIADYMTLARKVGSGSVPLVLSETSAASCGGCLGISDTFVHSLWFLDLLGRGVSHFALHQLYRQALFGPDHYALVSTSNSNVSGEIVDNFVRINPDYYPSLLWTRLVGPSILAIAGGGDNLRLYAACSRPLVGAVTVIFANWAPTPVNISLSTGIHTNQRLHEHLSGAAYSGWREEYHFTSTTGSLTGTDVSLNGGAALGVDSDLMPRMVRPSDGDNVVTLAGYSLGFITLVNVTAPACSPAVVVV